VGTGGQKNLSRARRLKSAERWVATYRGHDLVRSYKQRYGVSDVCAVLELRMLGVEAPDARLDEARRNEQDRAALHARRKQRKLPRDELGGSDETFAFIAGYTEGGAPYGTTWEEMERGTPHGITREEMDGEAPYGSAQDESDAAREQALAWRRMMDETGGIEDDDLPF
jgi:hypothetical protein